MSEMGVDERVVRWRTLCKMGGEERVKGVFAGVKIIRGTLG